MECADLSLVTSFLLVLSLSEIWEEKEVMLDIELSYDPLLAGCADSLHSIALIKEVGQVGQEVRAVLRGVGGHDVPDDSCLGDLVIRGGG